MEHMYAYDTMQTWSIHPHMIHLQSTDVTEGPHIITIQLMYSRRTTSVVVRSRILTVPLISRMYKAARGGN